MICPHCKRPIDVVVSAVRAKSDRAKYWRERYLKSGKAKVRINADQDGKCIDCGAPTEGLRWYCDGCRSKRRLNTFRLSSNKHYQESKTRKAVKVESTSKA